VHVLDGWTEQVSAYVQPAAVEDVMANWLTKINRTGAPYRHELSSYRKSTMF
jgi:hypothetical protein